MTGYRYHTNDRSPVANYPLDGRLDDVSGNGYDLSVVSGTARYQDIVPGLYGAWFDTTTILGVSTFESALAITGDMTIEMLVRTYTSQSHEFIYHGITGSETAANNFLYWLGCTSPNYLSYKSEHGTGTNADFNATAGLIPRVTNHLAMRREGGVITLFLNGEVIATSGVLTDPTGGTSGRLRIGGGSAGTYFWGVAASIVIFDRALTDAEVYADAAYTGFAEDPDPPYVSDAVPADGAVSIPRNSTLLFTLDDDASGVDLTTTTVELHDGTSWSNVYTGGAFQSGFSGSTASHFVLGQGYEFSIDHDTLFPLGETIQLRITGVDIAGNSSETILSYLVADPAVTSTTPIGPDCVDQPITISFVVSTLLPSFVSIDEGNTILTSTAVTLNGDTIYDGSGAAAGWTAVLTDLTDATYSSYQVDLTPDDLLAYSTLFTVDVDFTDSDGNTPDPNPTEWTFLTCEEPIPPVVPAVRLSRYQDSIRGLSTLQVGSNIKLVDETQDVIFTLPTHIWTASTTGISYVSHKPAGTTFRSFTSSQAELQSDSIYQSFDAHFLLKGLNIASGGQFSVAFTTDASDSLEIRFTNGLVNILRNGVDIGGGIWSLRTLLDCQIIRHSNIAWILLDGIVIGHVNDLQGDLGAFSITASGPCMFEVSKCLMRSHCFIDDQPLLEKVDFSERRIHGLVPPATDLYRLGQRSIKVFGPWGSVEDPDGFLYYTPTGRSLGQRLITFVDRQIDN